MKSQIEASTVSATQRPAGYVDELLADMGHELRSPLTSILALADALHDEIFGPLNEGQKQALLLIRDCVRRQTSLIADVIDLRRLEEGVHSLNPVPGRMDETVDRIMVKMDDDTVRARGVHLSREIMPANLSVCMDAKRLAQIVNHLLTAGVLAADREGVVRLSIDGTAGLRLELTVAPPGCEPVKPGPGPSDAAVERSLRKLYPTGLTLLQKVLELYGGDLAFQQSAEGHISLVASLPGDLVC